MAFSSISHLHEGIHHNQDICHGNNMFMRVRCASSDYCNLSRRTDLLRFKTMHKKLLCLIALTFAVVASLSAAERTWDFSEMPLNQPPKGCFSTVGGEGKPGEWKVITDELPLPFQPLSSNAPKTAPKAVVAQLARDYTDEHFPMLILGDDTYGDFTFKTKFKIADGLTEQMAGIAFRMQDEQNYYYVRASAMGSNFTFYTVVKGQRSRPIGRDMNFEKGVWHDLSIECSGATIRIVLDGNTNSFPVMNDPTFSAGKIAFWAKSDSISYFTDTKITYTPREPFAQLMVRDVMKEYPRLLGLKILTIPPKEKAVRLIASNDEKEIGTPGDKTDADVIDRGVNFFRRGKGEVYVTMPLRDRNGDAVAAVRFVMKGFPGETEDNALVRAMPMLKKMQTRAAAVDSLY